MDKVVQLNAQTAGRDKVARLLQYLSRIIWSKLQKSNRNGVDKFKNLEFQLSSFRKLLRFGKCLDIIYSILPLLKNGDSTVRLTVILSRISNSIFLLADHILWLGRSDMCMVDTDKWSRICSQYWLYSIIIGLFRDVCEILKAKALSNSKQLPKKKPVVLRQINIYTIMKTCYEVFACIQKYPQLTIDVIKNICDMFLPLAALGYLKLSPGTVGMLGTISSLAGLIPLLYPTCKLSP